MTAYYLGELTAISVIPILGLILLIVGLRQRSHAWQLPPGYSPPQPPTPSEYYPTGDALPRPVRSSAPLIFVGSIVLASGLLGMLSQIADAGPRAERSAHSADVGQYDSMTTLCLILNLKQGQCYLAGGMAGDRTFAASACDGSLPRFKVANRIDGRADTAVCPEGTKAISYPVPARLYCLERLEN